MTVSGTSAAGADTPVSELPDASEFDVSRIRALRGPNNWRLAPVIACNVHQGAFEHFLTSDIPGFTERLLNEVPTLAEHACSNGEGEGNGNGNFADRLREGTTLPHVLEHLALEFQTLGGTHVSFGRVVRSGDPNVWWVLVAYEEEELGIECMHVAVDLIHSIIAGEPFDTQAVISGLQNLCEDVRLGPSTAVIVEEARRRGIPVRRLNARSLVRLGMGRHLRRIQATLTDFTSAIAVEIAQDKEETKRVLSHIGLPVPTGRTVRSCDGAVEVAEDIGYPVLLKPLDASHGRGVSPPVHNAAEMQPAWEAACKFSSRVIVERYHEGRDHRVLVVDGRFVACAERVPAHVIGDGHSTIAALIEEENRDPRRGVGHRRMLTMLPSDERTVETLMRQGFTMETVLPPDATAYLRGTANLSTGGTSIDRTDEVHVENIVACEMAAGAIGLDVAGIDVLTPDISLPLRENRGVILEVNAAPGTRMHTHPTVGTPRNVAAAVLDMLYPPGAVTTIPIIAVTGTNGKTTTVRLIAHLFRNTGHRVGFTTSDGVYIQNRRVLEGDTTGPFAANIILSHPGVDVAVLETARGGLLRSGLGFDECDVGVVLNVTSDHLGLQGINTLEQLAALKGVVAAVVRRDGHAVLNADDDLVHPLRDRTTSDIVFFSTKNIGENPVLETHVSRGGIAACMNEGSFVIRRGRVQMAIGTEREIPLMQGGAARFQRQNVLAAAISAYVRGMRYDDIRAGLLSFAPSAALTPGRLNILRLASGARVLVDYAHNEAAVQGLLEFVFRLPAHRRLAVIAVPGDRRDEDIRAVGAPFARFDHVIIKEDADLRGRDEGEVAGLLRNAVLSAGLAPECVEIVRDEAAAVRRGMSLLKTDDLLVVLAAKVSTALSEVTKLAEVEP
jgi:cyanophycin synthetase